MVEYHFIETHNFIHIRCNNVILFRLFTHIKAIFRDIVLFFLISHIPNVPKIAPTNSEIF